MASIITNSIYQTHSKAISFNKQFCITSNDHSESLNQILFQPPNTSIIIREIKSIGASVHFTINKLDKEVIGKMNKEIQHIVEYISDLSSNNFSYTGCRLYVFIQENSALFIVKRITDYVFTQVFNYQSAEDLLYYIHACFHTLKLDKSDQLILCGEIEPESKIVRLISIYYSNIITDSSLPLSSLTMQ